MARIVVRLYATLRSVSGSESVSLEVSSLRDVDRELRERFGPDMGTLLGPRDAPFEGVVLLLNGVNVSPDGLSEVRLRDGDEVALFPPVSGG